MIAKAFKEVGLIERYGSGIRRVINICNDYGVKQPLFEEAYNGFRVILFKEKTVVTKSVFNETDKVTDRVTDRDTDNLTENQQRILKLMSENKKVTTSRIADNIGISKRKVLDNINKLKLLGFIKRIGSAKGGHWEISINP